MLEAMMWMIEDNEGEKLTRLLKNYEGLTPFMVSAWGAMDGARWKEYEDVVRRLNHPFLSAHYTRWRFTYQADKNPVSLDSKETFDNKGGVCRHYATFVTDALGRAGYDVDNLTVIWGREGHTVSVLRDANRKYWVVDDTRTPGRIKGPYNERSEIVGVLSRGSAVTGIYIEGNQALYERNRRAFGR